jgi:hypothetical protein
VTSSTCTPLNHAFPNLTMAGITKLLGIAFADAKSGRITEDQLHEIVQEALDNGDILADDNEPYVLTDVHGLVRAGAVVPTRHLHEAERRAEGLRTVTGARTRRSRIEMGARWLLLLPTAAAAALIARVVLIFVGRVGMLGSGIPSETAVWNFSTQYIGGLALGAAFVYVGTAVAPAFKRTTSIVLAAVVVFVGGMTFLPVVQSREYFALVELGMMLLGSSGVAAAVALGELNVGQD